ncbi:uncharacterized protein N7503_004549 [Penicillium pulvis]|uniref:uncharacterized protein n=1 Tax=Penicillium pulvis TaxID=1562058 RepID=UPI0025499269|nr:uncharacterized protein N7503_004549 [Penicillium pulvis]KAJ5802099.1 hypothetical protein N7503_004549 [Penicillium pulvis]
MRLSWNSQYEKRPFSYVCQLEEQVKILSSNRKHPQADSDAGSGTTQSNIVGQRGDTLLQQEPSQADCMQIPLDTRATTGFKAARELVTVNRHTRSFEFYGSSSSVAMLVRMGDTGDPKGEVQCENEELLVSALHNPAFSPEPIEALVPAAETGTSAQSVSVSTCRLFVDSFFATLHYIHPILNKSAFVARILSLGALLRPKEEELIGSIGNMQQSRKFFEEARRRSNPCMVMDLELAKVCQNELNPNWAYMHIGLAIRIALSIGINREPPLNSNKDLALLKAESRTWWGLYFLETEIAFSLGRPDTLGPDQYHNRHYPIIVGDHLSAKAPSGLLEQPDCAIIKYMVDLSRITKSICLDIYLSDSTLEESVMLGGQIEQDLECWVESLPSALRPLNQTGQRRPLKAAIEPQYVKKQRLATTIRYHNLRILLFGPLLMKSSTTEHSSTIELQRKIKNCLDSARLTIEIIYETYQHQEFFRTWYYNTTYIIFAAAIILVYIFQEAGESELDALLKLVEMSVEILEIMEESVVTTKAAMLIRRALSRAQRRNSKSDNDSEVSEDGNLFPFKQSWGAISMNDCDLDFGFPFQFRDLGVDHYFGDLMESP